MEETITLEELKKTAQQLAKERTPGKDGLPVKFYTKFWDDIKLVYDYVRDIQNEGLNDTQNISITKIYKKYEKNDLKNYRPIFLINVDIKILTKVLVNRIKEVLPTIIHKIQTCIKGRKIDTTIYIIRDLIQLAENKNIRTAIIFLTYA